MEKKDNRILWISCAKFVSILAVIIDHLHSIAYSRGVFVCLSYFSVSTFVFLSGITSYYSIQRHTDRKITSELWRKVQAILIPYFFATFIYQIVFERFFNMQEYVEHLIRFDISGPFYFVVFYIQLVLIAPLLAKLLLICRKAKLSIICYITYSAIIIFISIFAINRTLIVDGYGGSRYLFGGSYLIMFFGGMLAAHIDCKCEGIRRKLIILAVTLVTCIMFFCYIIISQFTLDSFLPFGEGKNPPGLLIMIYSLLVCIILYSFFSVVEEIGGTFVKKVLLVIAYMGDCSLYIFLYHEMVLRVTKYILKLLHAENFYASFLIYIPLMLAIPVAGKYLYDKVKRKILNG